MSITSTKVWLALVLLGLPALSGACATDTAAPPVNEPLAAAKGGKATCSLAALPESDLITAVGSQFMRGNQVFQVSGGNSFMAHYDDQEAASVMALAAKQGFTVMRVWGFIDVGSVVTKGSGTYQMPPHGGSTPNVDPDAVARQVWFQGWDDKAVGPLKTVINSDSRNGVFAKLDQLLCQAETNNVRLIIVLTNNWSEFGGVPQYLRWFGRDMTDRAAFFVDENIKDAYKAWVAALVGRYQNKSTILGWELINEPRCEGCNPQLITNWVTEMARYVKQLGARQLVGVGDEGWGLSTMTSFAGPYGDANGTSAIDLLAVSEVDFGTMHLYPENWGVGGSSQLSQSWGQRWIADHLIAACQDLPQSGSFTIRPKPMVLGEFGLKDRTTRIGVYDAWTRDVDRRGGAGWLVWELFGDARKVPKNDTFALAPSSPELAVLKAQATSRTSPYNLIFGSGLVGDITWDFAPDKFDDKRSIDCRAAIRAPSTPRGAVEVDLERIGQRWYGTSLRAPEAAFGKYSIGITGGLDMLPGSMVLSLFSYGDATPSDANRTDEIDIEVSRFGSDPNNLNFSVWPRDGVSAAKASQGFSISPVDLNAISVHAYSWGPLGVVFESVFGSSAPIRWGTPATYSPFVPAGMPLLLSLWAHSSVDAATFPGEDSNNPLLRYTITVSNVTVEQAGVGARVEDATTGQPLPGASVTALGGPGWTTPLASAVTGADGRFTFRELSPGTLKLNVQLSPYSSATVPVTLSSNVTTDAGVIGLTILSPPSAWCNQFLDFDSGAAGLPAGWLTFLHSVSGGTAGFANGRVEANPIDAGFRVGAIGLAPPGTAQIVVEYDALNASTFSGMNHDVSLVTTNGEWELYDQNVAPELITLFSWKVIGIWPSAQLISPAGRDEFRPALPATAPNHYKITLTANQATWEVNGTFAATHSLPGFDPAQVTEFYWSVYTTNGLSTWGDNLSVSCR